LELKIVMAPNDHAKPLEFLETSHRG